MPTDESFGRNDGQDTAPGEPAAEPSEAQACLIGGPARLDAAFPVERELFAQEGFSAASELLARKVRITKWSKSARRLSPSRQDFIMDRWSLISVSPFKSFAIWRVSSHAESFCGVQ